MTEASGPSSRPLAIDELIKYVLGKDPAPDSPPVWPPDMFAVAAIVLKRTGTYLCGAESNGYTCEKKGKGPTWPKVRGEWHERLNGSASASDSVPPRSDERLSRSVLWAPRGEIPRGYPTAPNNTVRGAKRDARGC
jgi:hypothetical protein